MEETSDVGAANEEGNTSLAARIEESGMIDEGFTESKEEREERHSDEDAEGISFASLAHTGETLMAEEGE